MKKILGIVTVLIVLASCSGSKVMYDYDHEANFTQYKTFNFHPNMNLSTISELDGKRMLNAIESQMEEKGYQLSDTPDLYVDVAPSSKTSKKQAGSIGLGLGNFGRNFGINIGTSVPITKQVEDSSLVLEMIDANSNQMIWQGVFEDTTNVKANPEQKEAIVNKSVGELLLNFPPEIK